MFNPKFTTPNDIIGLDVYLEIRRTRRFVGYLERVNNNEKVYVFTYDKHYMSQGTSIEVGPDLPLTKKVFKSKSLFKSIKDRIPSKGNPAYAEYCEDVGISPREKNKIILLATIGRRGPSSFAFEPRYREKVSQESRSKFRNKLDLTIREFSSVFDFSTKTVQKIEKGDLVARDSQKRLDTYILFPETAIYDLARFGGSLMPGKRINALTTLEKLQKEQIQRDVSVN